MTFQKVPWIVPERVWDPKLHLRLLTVVGPAGKPGMEPSKEERDARKRIWTNAAGERFESQFTPTPKDKDFAAHILVTSAEGEAIRRQAKLIVEVFDDKALSLFTLRHPDNEEYEVPPENEKGRGFFGVILTEALLFAEMRGYRTILICPMTNHLVEYYMTYGFHRQLEGNRLQFNVGSVTASHWMEVKPI